VAYEIGARGGRRMVERWGAWVLLDRDELDRMQRYFTRFGGITVLVCRMLPLVRTFIALPAGLARMRDRGAKVTAKRSGGRNRRQIEPADGRQIAGEWHDDLGWQRDAGGLDGHQPDDAKIAAAADRHDDDPACNQHPRSKSPDCLTRCSR
jgi:hypothetical protein